MPKYYTVREANDKLPELTQLLLDMQEQGRQLAALQGKAAALQRKVRSNGHYNHSEDAAPARSTSTLEDALRAGIDQLAEWNIELKDLQRGLVDFPALRDDHTVYLCWQLGEPDVAYWHEIEEGFAGRQPLDDKLL